MSLFAGKRCQLGHSLRRILGGFIHGGSFSDSVKDRVSTGIKRGVKKLHFILHLQSDEDRRQEDIDAGVSSFRNGIRLRTVV